MNIHHSEYIIKWIISGDATLRVVLLTMKYGREFEYTETMCRERFGLPQGAVIL